MQIKEIEKQMTDRNINFQYIAISESNFGNSIYYTINGKKARFSDHSVTNKNRVMDELHFDMPFKKTLGLGGVINNIYNDNVKNFEFYGI